VHFSILTLLKTMSSTAGALDSPMSADKGGGGGSMYTEIAIDKMVTAVLELDWSLLTLE